LTMSSMNDNTTTPQQENIGKEDEGLASSLANLRSILNIDNSPKKSSHSASVVLRGFERITEVESQLKEEKSLRRMQEESYEALSKYNKELSMQLELLNKSRAKLEDRFNSSDRALQAEKAQLAKEQTERKTEMERMEKEKSESLNEIERLKARNLFFQRQNEELKVFHQQSKDLKAELEAQKQEMEEKQAHSEERHNIAVRRREELEQRLEEIEKTMKAEVSVHSWHDMLATCDPDMASSS
jgi:DNA repair exonuclease SbcCD ATPase subunit